jgi:trigger factor
MALIRARHDVFGVKDVPDNDFYRENGWVKVDPSTPTTAQERRRAENEARRGTFDPAEHKAEEVVDHLEGAPDDEKARVLAAEKAGKGRKTVLDGAE